jgi:hypothetical protein
MIRSRRASLVALAAGSVKLTPLIVGGTIAISMGPYQYSDAVLALSAASLVGTFPMLAVVPLILRAGSYKSANSIGLFGVTAGLAVLVGITPAIYKHTGEATGYFVSLYAAGVFLQAVSQAMNHQRKESGKASIHAASVMLFVAMAGVCAAVLLNSFTLVMETVAAALLLSASVSLFFTASGEKWRGFAKWNSLQISENIRSALLSGLFGVLVLAGIYYSNLSAARISTGFERAAFSVGMQAFAAIIFIPGALSAYVLPQWRETNTDIVKVVTACGWRYSAIGAILAIVTLLASPFIFALIGIPLSESTLIPFGVLLVTAIAASFNAALTQGLVSQGRFLPLAAMAGMWLLLLYILLLALPKVVTAIGIALLLAYILKIAGSRWILRRTRQGNARPEARACGEHAARERI